MSYVHSIVATSSQQQFISVIVCFSNGERYIAECLKSISNQIDISLELILIDDGSTDMSLNIANKYLSNFKNFVIIKNNCRRGVSYSRNLGIRISSCPYIAFMDCDDFYPTPDTLSKLHATAIMNNAVIAGGSLLFADSESRCFEKKIRGQYFSIERPLTYSKYQHDGGFYRFIYYREFLINNNITFPYLARYQDAIFFYRALTRTNSFYTIPDYTYVYRKGHKLVQWNRRNFIDHIAGVLYLMRESSKSRLANLHFLMIQNAIRSILTKSRCLNIIEVLYLSKEFSNRINFDLLKNFGTCTITMKWFCLVVSPLVRYFYRARKS